MATQTTRRREKIRTPGRRQERQDRNHYLEQLWDAHIARPSLETRNALLEGYYWIVEREAERTAAALTRAVTAPELASAGALGLLDCIEKFDPAKGCKFVTFSLPRVRGAMIDEMRSWDWMPRATRTKLNRLEKALALLDAEGGRGPEEEALAQHLDVTPDELRRLVHARGQSRVSLDRRWTDDADGGGGDSTGASLADTREADPAVTAERAELIEVLARSLTEIQRMVITMYYFEGLSLKETGEVLHLTESRICQIRKEVIDRLRKQLA
jgi:RNA polymerase sigma factor for flagellar operon FliA